jgi:hypothetical protein
MDVEAFLASIENPDMRLPAVGWPSPTRSAPETIDALFHLPLLALVTMVVAAKTPLTTTSVGSKVALLLIEQFGALRRSPHSLEISLTLRRRCADALAFLEAANLVVISSDTKRTVTLTKSGKEGIARARRDSSDLGFLVRQLLKNQGRVSGRVGSDEH